MVPRSYTKSRDLPLKRDVWPTHAVGTEFDEHLKQTKSLANLSVAGQKIIDKFVKDNTKNEEKMREREKEIWEYKHSKPEIQYNPWKPSNHIITEFSVPPGDKIHSFRVEPKRKFLIQEPYLVNKRDGDYFYDRETEGHLQLHF